MPRQQAVLTSVRTALESEPRLAGQSHAISVVRVAGVVALEGEVADIAAKKLALERVATVPGIEGIVDRLRVQPAERMGDGAVRDAVCRALLQEPALAECGIAAKAGRGMKVLRAPQPFHRQIDVEVEAGVVTLNGAVPGLGHKRLAGVLCWWVPGSRDVVNGLEVVPDEPDNDAEITDAVRLVLEKDPFVNAGQIQVGTHDRVVTLRGLVPTPAERHMAEFDAWYVFGVDRVKNEIQVQP